MPDTAHASILLLVLSAVLLVPAAAGAQQRGRSDEDRAREHFETGASLYQQENYEGALAAFEESYRLRPVPVVLFNIAQTQRRLYRYAEAIDSYERYLAEDQELPAARRAAVRGTIRELRRALAPVTIETDVPGVEIRVDGRSVGTTPLPGPLRLAAGERHLVAERDGYVTVREDLQVVGGEPAVLRLRMPPEETAGTLRVGASVDGAEARIDGVDVGVVPVVRTLGEGGHSVEVEAPGYETFRQEIVLAARQERDLLAELEPERALTERWWFWTGIGAVVVAGVAIAIAASSGGQADPVPGTLGTVAALR